ncbi:MAG: hypothetical protein U7123_18825 [Potamolinea sp.]
MKNRKQPIRFLLSIIGLSTILSACVAGYPNRDSTPTLSPTAEGTQKTTDQRLPQNTLAYRGPMEESIPAGSFLPGTNIKYVGITPDKTAEVSIGGQRAFKRSGDSLEWKGSLLSGVDVQLRDRILWYGEKQLQLVGTMNLTIDNVAPKRSSIPQISTQSTPNLIVHKVPVIYQVKRGETIPGTTLIYQGKTEKGVQLGGLPKDEYPYRLVGDTITWQGELRSQVYLDLLLRTVAYNNDNLDVTGWATIILASNNQNQATNTP